VGDAGQHEDETPPAAGVGDRHGGFGDDLIRLTVPTEPDFVAVVRLTVQAVAARCGCTDDARSRLVAAAGSAFFDLAVEAGSGGSVLVELHTDDDRVLVDLTARPAPGNGDDPLGRRTVQVEVEDPSDP
jgi:hypothetical protein